MSLRFMSVCTVAVALLSASPAVAQLRRSGFIGVKVGAVPDLVRADLGLSPGVGVLVQSVVGGGSAESAGIQPNDVITDVGDGRVTNVADFVELAKHLRAGDVVTVRLRRAREHLALPVTIRGRPYEEARDAEVLYDAISVDGSLRRTIVTAPRQPGRHPAALYVNGIGCFSQESLDLASNDAKLLYGLTRQGFVTMRVEKAGTGDSGGPACTSPDADFHAEMRAYTAGLRALKQYAFVDSDKVFVIGVSVGGVEAPLIAASEPVRGIVVINTVAKPFVEYLMDSRRRQMALRHLPYDEIDRRMAVDERCNHRLLVNKESPDAILASSPECADHITYPAPFTFMQQWTDVNIAAAWKAVDRPVLITYGTSDFVANASDHQYLADMINAFHPGTATLRPITGMDHPMNKAASMAESFARSSPGEFEPKVLETIADWLRAEHDRKQ